MPSGHEQVTIKAPTLDEFDTDDESDGDNDQDTLPLTRDELKQRTLKGLAARERLHGGGGKRHTPARAGGGNGTPAGMRRQR